MHISLYLYAMSWCTVLTADVHGGGTAVCTPADVVAGVLGGSIKAQRIQAAKDFSHLYSS
jgi:hypothetical protein